MLTPTRIDGQSRASSVQLLCSSLKPGADVETAMWNNRSPVREPNGSRSAQPSASIHRLRATKLRYYRVAAPGDAHEGLGGESSFHICLDRCCRRHPNWPPVTRAIA